MKSFREQQNEQNNHTTAQGQHTATEDLTRQAGALAGMSEEQLTATLLQEAAKLKAAGKLDDATLRAFYTQTAPLLNEEQRRKMEELLRLLRE